MTILTTNEYWDCECSRDYIHPKSEYFCDNCKVRRTDSPDSRVSEVELLHKQLFIVRETIEMKPKYVGVAVDIHHNGGKHISTQVVHQGAPYYNPTEALEKVLPFIKTLHNVVMIEFRQAYE